MPKKVNFEEKIKSFNEIHKHKYDYSKSVYVDSKTKIEIICPIHGPFFQRINHHSKGAGCPNCNPRKKVTLKDFKERCDSLLPKHITLDFNTFKNTQSKVKGFCKLHGLFEQYAYNILRGQHCPKCGHDKGAKYRSKSTEDFIKQVKIVHNNFYDYSLVDYKNAHTKVTIVCPIHGNFEQTPHNHLKGRGCPKCGINKTTNVTRNSKSIFIENANKIHNNFYDYSLVDGYLNNKSKVTIICPKHGPFEQRPSNHISGQGCPNCATHISKGEQEIADYIKSLGLEIIQSDRSVLDGSEIDILIPELKIGIEYNGLYFHREGLLEGIGGGKTKYYHVNKTDLANEKGYNLIHIFEDEWMFKSEIIKAKLSHILHKSTKKSIGARKCKIKEISHNVAKEFLNLYHIQGYDNAKLRYGAYYEDKLVGLMTFVEVKKGTNSWKLNRYATNFDYHIVGLASKLLKHFERDIAPKDLITFADRRFTVDIENNLYAKIGFDFDKISEPSYYYIKKNDYVRNNRVGFMKHKLLENNPQFDKSMTEKEMATQLGYDRIYDCGNFKFVKKYVKQ